MADLDALDGEIREEALASDRPIFDLMAGLVAGLRRHPLIRRVLEEGTSGDLALVLDHRLFRATTEVIADRLRMRLESGVLPPGSDPDVLALGIETVVFSIVLSIVRAGLEEDAERLDAVVSLLRAAAGGPPRPGEVFGRASAAGT